MARRVRGEEPELSRLGIDVGASAHYEDPDYYDHAYRARRDDIAFYTRVARLSGGPVLEYGVGTGRIGRMEAPHATSVGKAIMAWLPEDEIHRILTGGMKRFTDKTITELPALINSLRAVRRNGYAIDREEHLPGVICVGAAIRDQAGTVIGAISASTPTMRADEDHIALMREEITAATRALSAEYGEPSSNGAGQRTQAAAG